MVSDNGTARIKPDGSNARLIQKLKLQPYRQYHVRVRIKTRDFRGTPEIKALAEDGTSLQWANLGFSRRRIGPSITRSLTRRSSVRRISIWESGADSGDLWWDDASIEEVAFLNMVRRPGAPLTVRTAEGKSSRKALTTIICRSQDGERAVAGEFTVYTLRQS